MMKEKERLRALVADDDPSMRMTVRHLLEKWNFEVREANDGWAAWRAFGEEDFPQLVILDWEMPGLEGLEICRRIRSTFGEEGIHVILLTMKSGTGSCVRGLEAGADDYIVKPFEVEEFRARVFSGERILRMREALAGKIRDLEGTLADIRTKGGMISSCSCCGKVRSESGGWENLEDYLTRRTGVLFSHTVCPDCYPTTKELEPSPEGGK
ncbi:MAG: response regulator [Candidatus Sumerlaeia bacterium]|nr:response regulator [Candidatus Sumerlaeia bacterium]